MAAIRGMPGAGCRMAKGSISRWASRYLTNNHHFTKSHPLYRRVYLLNGILTVMLIFCSFFVAVDVLFFKLYTAALVNGAAVAFALFALLYFKRTNRYEVVAHISVLALVMGLLAFFLTTQNQHYGFVWLSIFPPITFFLLKRTAARVVTGLFGSIMLYVLFSNASSWGPSEFGLPSILNILGAGASLLFMVSYYEYTIEAVWNEHDTANRLLDENKKALRLLLDSSAEAIFGVDEAGNCTFCNRSCLNMLGYPDEGELLGKNMHALIHHSRPDGTPFPREDCRILKAYADSKGTQAEDEVFWRADGTSFPVEYFSHPQIAGGKTVGIVVTFMDISERRHREDEILFLSRNDPLTGLLNRRSLEEDRGKLDRPENLPLSVIFADINGLKLTNDVFGHPAGDELIRNAARILQQASGPKDRVFRLGGDEFVLLLPGTGRDRGADILEEIRSGFAGLRTDAIKCSISLGLGTKTQPNQLLGDVMANAENAMYRDKATSHASGNGVSVDSIIQALHRRSEDEKRHSNAVARMCAELGYALGFSETEIGKVRRAGYLHDIGKIILDAELLQKAALTDEEYEKLRQHSAVGYRILSLFNDTLDLAEYVYSHHERWDGTGYPRGLKGAEIPLLSRIISVAETYDRVLHRGTLPLEGREAAALTAIREGAGTQFDPQVADLFAHLAAKGEGLD